MGQLNRTWEGEFEGFTVNFWKRNFWRVARTLTWDDAMQESRLVFVRCARKYPLVGSKHFMALYRTALTNRTADLANEDTVLKGLALESELIEEEGEAEEIRDSLYGTYSLGQLFSGHQEIDQILSSAPDEVREVLSMFLNAPQEVLEAVFGQWKQSGGKKAHGNRFLCHVLGYDPATVDLVTPCKRFLKGEIG